MPILRFDALTEMRSTASLDQKLAYFRQMLSQDFHGTPLRLSGSPVPPFRGF